VKKKFWIFFISIFFVSIFFFSYKIFGRYLISSYSQKFLKEKISFERFYLKDKKIVIEDIKGCSDKIDFFLEKAFIGKIFSHPKILLFKPKIILKKCSLDIRTLKNILNKLVDFKMEVEEGEILVLDTNNKMFFELKKNVFYLNLGEDSEIVLDFVKHKDILEANFRFLDVDLFKLDHFFKNFNLNIKGKLNGEAFLKYETNSDVCFNFSFSNLFIKKNHYKNNLFIQKLNIEGKGKDKFLLKNFKINGEAENLLFKSGENIIFKNVFGYFVYDPNKKIEFNFKNKDSFCLKGDEKSFIVNFLKDNSKIFLKKLNKNNIFLELENVKYEFLDIFEKKKEQENFRFLKGKISGNFEINRDIQKIYFKKLDIKDINLEWKKYPIYIKSIKGNGEIDRSNFLKSTFSDLEISNIQFLEKTILLDAFFKINEGHIEKGSVKGRIEDLETEINIGGELLNIDAEINFNGDLGSILKNNYKNNVKAKIFCKSKKKEFDFSGIIDMEEREHVAFGLKLKNFDFSFWVRGERVVLEKWKRFLPFDIQGRSNIYLFSNGKKLKLFLKGENLRYQNEYIDLQIDRLGDIRNNLFKDDSLFLSYNISDKKVFVDVKKANGNFYLKNNGLKFSFENSEILFKNLIFQFNLPKVQSLNLDLKGMVFLDISKDKPKLDINAYFAKGKVEDLSLFLKHFSLKIPKIKGFFETKKRGFYFSKILSADEKEVVWRGEFLFKDIKTFTKNIFFKEIDINITSSNGEIGGDFYSKVFINKHVYSFFCNSFLKNPDELKIDCKIGNDLFEILSFSASSKIDKDRFKIFINPKSHLLGERLNISECILNKDLKIESLKIDHTLKISNIEFLMKSFLGDNFLKNGIFKKFFKKNFSYNLLSKKEKPFFLSVWLDKNKRLKFQVKGDDLFVFNRDIKKVLCEGSIKNKEVRIDKFLIDDFLVKGNIFLEESVKVKEFSILKNKSKVEGEILFCKNRFDIKLKNIEIEEENFFNLKNIKKISFEGGGWVSCLFQENKRPFLEADLDLNRLRFYYKDVFVENSSCVNFNYSNKKGLELSKIDLNFFSDKIDLSAIKTKIKYVRYDAEKERWDFQKIDCYIPKELAFIFEKNIENKFFEFMKNNVVFEKDLELLLDLEYFPKKSIFSFELQEGVFYINKLKRQIKNAKIKITPNDLSFESFYFYRSLYHKISSYIDFKKRCGKFIIGDNLVVSWDIKNNRMDINKIKGRYLGLEFDLIADKNNKENFVLFGNIKIDFSNLNFSFFEKLKFLEIGKGYQLRGYFFINRKDYTFNKFEGEIFAKKFEIKKAIFKTLFAKAFISNNIVEIKDFKISDKSGIVQIKKIECEKIENRWKFSIPLIEVFEVRPSLIKGKKKDMKPLVITNFNIYQLEGFLDDFSTIRGKGDFHFLNSFKREQNLFEIPADVLGRILSLDADILIPVHGDISFEIRDEKFFITKMKDVYSENRRSKFFMVDKPYMDFNGNLNINVKMKQYVLFKLTEKFIISIKGKVNTPKVHLKKKGR